MVYKLISASNVIANVQDRFNVDDSDFIGRSGNWLNKGLSDLGVITELVVTQRVSEAIEYRVELPCDIKSLEAIEIDGKRVLRSNQLRNSRGVIDGWSYDNITYTVQGDGYIQLETENEYFRDVAVTVHFKSLPVELFKPFGVYLPLVPDIDIVQEALALFIFIRILGRGYSHNVYSLSHNDPVTNPYYMYHGMNLKGGVRLKARIAVKTMDSDERENASISARSLNHPDRHFTKDFNGKY